MIVDACEEVARRAEKKKKKYCRRRLSSLHNLHPANEESHACVKAALSPFPLSSHRLLGLVDEDEEKGQCCSVICLSQARLC